MEIAIPKKAPSRQRAKSERGVDTDAPATAREHRSRVAKPDLLNPPLERGLAEGFASSLTGPIAPAVAQVLGMDASGSRIDPESSIQVTVGEIAARPAMAEGSGARVADAKAKYIHEDSQDPLVQAALAAVIERVPEIVRARQEKLSQEVIDLLVDAYLKSAPAAPARHEIEMDNARERARFVEEFPCYTSREVAELAGHEAANASATATRWKKARRIVGLPWKGSDLYPAFQFSEGRPRPAIGRVIAALPAKMSPWQIAFWLTSNNGWLGGATPLERLEGDADAISAAAGREGEAFEG